MSKKAETGVLDFMGCNCAVDFFDRIIASLGLGAGGVDCGRNWSAVYDFGCTESTVEMLIIKNTKELTEELKAALPKLYETLDDIKEDRVGRLNFNYRVTYEE